MQLSRELHTRAAMLYSSTIPEPAPTFSLLCKPLIEPLADLFMGFFEGLALLLYSLILCCLYTFFVGLLRYPALVIDYQNCRVFHLWRDNNIHIMKIDLQL